MLSAQQRVQEPRQRDAVVMVRARVVGGTEYRGTFVPGRYSR